MISPNDSPEIGVLISGGLDSSILLGHLLERQQRVRPIYIRSDVAWELPERQAVERFLSHLRSPCLADLVQLELPVRDLYRDHWSITSENVPKADSPDQAVFLPGRNALLAVKASIWCQMNAVGQLNIATLGTSPFDDASAEFWSSFTRTMNRMALPPIEIARPFVAFNKRQVMQLGAQLPLELTFSCINPRRGLHCGRCNKCQERKAAFQAVGRDDLTCYAAPSDN